MSDEPLMLKCPECDTIFYVVWQNNAVYKKPEHCPFCGEEIDYEDLAKEQR